MFKKLRKLLGKIEHYFRWEFLTGHIDIGRLTIYGRNTMHWGVKFYTKKYGYICFRLPLPCDGHWWPLYLYFSPNGTPWASTFMLGRKHNKDQWIRSRIRYSCFGHNFDTNGWDDEYGLKNSDIVTAINNMISPYRYQYAKWAKEHGATQKKEEEYKPLKTGTVKEPTTIPRFIRVKLDLCSKYNISSLKDPYKSVYDYFKKFKHECYLVHEDACLCNCNYPFIEVASINMNNIVGYIRDIDIENKTCTVDFLCIFKEYANPEKYRVTYAGFLGDDGTIKVTKLCLAIKEDWSEMINE